MNNTPTILILVGITGDLSKRKLLPAIEGLKERGLLAEQFELVGITRTDNDKGYFVMDLDNADDYQRLAQHLKEIEQKWGTPAQRLFYLSVAPTVSPSIISHLGASGLAVSSKLLLEKPFAVDIDSVFSEEQIYRIDHYLAKHSVRALSAFDLENIKTISLTAAESLSIEGRAGFYEQTGALKDVAQSHLLEVAATVIAPHSRLEALKGFSVEGPVRRGQYEGYRAEAHNPDSAVETFVSVPLVSEGSLFKGTLLLTTGKAMDRKHTDLSVVFKDGAIQVYSLNDTDNAYENVFIEAIEGKKEQFVTREEVLETYRIVAPIQEQWEQNSDDLFIYEKGTDPKQSIDD